MQTIIVSKDKTPEIADWAADKEPGDRVCLYGTIKENDDKSLTITVEEVGDHKEEEEEKPEGGNEGADAAPAESPGGGASALTDETAGV